jgi:hypothetical protein
MDLAEALDIVVARTGHERYRELAATRSDYAELILRLAEDPNYTNAPSQETIAITLMVCPHQRIIGCSCGKQYECAVTGAGKSIYQCQQCFYGMSFMIK